MVEEQDSGNDQSNRRDAALRAEEGVSVERATEFCSDGTGRAGKSSAEMETKVGYRRSGRFGAGGHLEIRRPVDRIDFSTLSRRMTPM